jgi:hypothetical protein
MSTAVHLGQEAWRGNVVVAHRRHVAPMRAGWSDGQVKRPSAIGTGLVMGYLTGSALVAVERVVRHGRPQSASISS